MFRRLLRCSRNLGQQLVSKSYWVSWADSFIRILIGFAVAQVLGIPLGLLLGVNKTARELIYPIFEIMRPIPPLAWVPIAVIFWPTNELSMMFVTFLGAFFTVVLNIIGGARSIDARYIRAAYSLGSTRADIFWKIMVPATLPSIVVGMTVGMGITWAVVVAAEMIASRSGLGFLTWQSYVAGDYPMIVIGMMSIGVAGYISSALIRIIGSRMTPGCGHFRSFFMSATQMALAIAASEMVVEGISKGFGVGPLHKQVLCDCSFPWRKPGSR